MASPLGHSLLGLTFGRIFPLVEIIHPWKWHLFYIVAANAADLDFLPGFFVGDINRYHQGVTHTFLSAAVFGIIIAFGSRFFKIPSLSVEYICWVLDGV